MTAIGAVLSWIVSFLFNLLGQTERMTVSNERFSVLLVSRAVLITCNEKNFPIPQRKFQSFKNGILKAIRGVKAPGQNPRSPSGWAGAGVSPRC